MMSEYYTQFLLAILVWIVADRWGYGALKTLMTATIFIMATTMGIVALTFIAQVGVPLLMEVW